MAMRIAANLFSVVPGLGHVVLGRTGRGVVLFFLFVLFLNVFLLAPYLVAEAGVPRTARGSLVAAGLVWAYAWMDVIHITYWRLRKAFLKKKPRLYCEVHGAYVGNRLDEARSLLKRLVRMDPEEPAGHFYLGIVYRDLGHYWRARTRFKQALWVDPKKAWKPNVLHQLAILKAMRRAT